MKRFFRKWYVPGWISLFILPPLFIHHAIRTGDRKQIYSFTLAVAGLPHDQVTYHEREEEICFSETHFPLLRNYSTVLIDDHTLKNNVNILIAVSQLREIYSMQDTVNGVHFRFSDKASYGTFVQVVDIIRFTTRTNFLICPKDIWIYYYPVKPKQNGGFQGCFLYNDIVTVHPVPKARTPLDLIRQGWQLIRKDGLSISITFVLFSGLVLLMGKRSALRIRTRSMP